MGMFTKDPVKQAIIADMLMDTYIGPGAWRLGAAGGYADALRHSTNTGLPRRYAGTFLRRGTGECHPTSNGTYSALVAAAITNAFQQVVPNADAEQAVDEAWASVQLEM